jgi:hypothetical protein
LFVDSNQWKVAQCLEVILRARVAHQGTGDEGLAAAGDCFVLRAIGNNGFPSIYLGHGALDKEVKISVAKSVTEKLPQCDATYYPDEGHI